MTMRKPGPACPFCNSAHTEVVCAGSAWFAECHECGATGPSIEDGVPDDSSKAAEAWAAPAKRYSELFAAYHDAVAEVFAMRERCAKVCEAEAAAIRSEGDGCRTGQYDFMAAGAERAAEAIRGGDE